MSKNIKINLITEWLRLEGGSSPWWSHAGYFWWFSSDDVPGEWFPGLAGYSCSTTSKGLQGGWPSCSSPGPPSCFLENRSDTCLPLVFGYYFSCHSQRLSKMALQRHLPAPSALMGASHQGPWMYVCTFSLLKYSLIWPSSSKGASFLLQPFPLVSGTWDSWRLVLLVKNWGKGSIQFSSLFHILCYQVPHFIQQWTHIFPRLLLVTYVPIKALLDVFSIPGQI